MRLALSPVGLTIHVRRTVAMRTRPTGVVRSRVLTREKTHELALPDRIHVVELKGDLNSALRARLLRHHERNFAETTHLRDQAGLRCAIQTNAVTFALIEPEAAHRHAVSASCRAHAWL